MHIADGMNMKDGLIGGLILGGSATAFMILTGKITGISGIVEGLVVIDGQDWNASYLLGLLTAGFVCRETIPSKLGGEVDLSMITLSMSGIISGFGARLSGGCTSGHGLCGLGRFSPRSLTAVLAFMTSGMLAAGISRSEAIRPYLSETKTTDQSFIPRSIDFVPTIVIVSIGMIRANYLKSQRKQNDKKVLPSSLPSSSSSSFATKVSAFTSGFIFGLGLGWSGMASSEKVVRFLDINGSEGWDPSLIAVLGGGVTVTALLWPYFQRTEIKTIVNQECLGTSLKIGRVPENLKIDSSLVIGSILFGMGWGITGICPGPGIVNFGAGKRVAISYLPGLMIGIMLKDLTIPK